MYHNLVQSHLDRYKASFLSATAKSGRITELASLLEISSPSLTELQHALHEAIHASHANVVSLLLANGADPNLRDSTGNNALHVAALLGNLEVCSLFLKHESARDLLNALNDDGFTPFDVSFENGHFAIAQQIKNVMDNANFNLSDDGFEEELQELQDELELEEQVTVSRGGESPPCFQNDDGDCDSLLSHSEQDSLYSQSEHEAVETSKGRNLSKERESERIHETLLLLNALQEENFSLKEKLRTQEVRTANAQNALIVMEKQLAEKEETIQRFETIVNGENLNQLSLDNLNNAEEQLLESIERIRKQKQIMIESKLSAQEEKSCCVICQCEAKSILLLPCRHLCVCDGCSKREELVNCPLCRTFISERISTYM
ncbi:hypothetical protein CTEN210_15932 [Chaetoceros tenuissimus]|uniref:RING-type domain-containing protein n=1 Tax=Chaetoceros tenuissimus TaxID=426638 RepID=A0AAD3D7V6_9STRA|nr:hypothetical protein CTEN210_15932 [Chaetoceros tenuissimus]